MHHHLFVLPFFSFSFIISSNHSSMKVGNKVGITSVGESDNVGEKVGNAEDGTYVGSGVSEAVGSDVSSEVGGSVGFMDVGLIVSVEVFIKSNATIKSARGVFVSLQHIRCPVCSNVGSGTNVGYATHD